MAIKGWCLGFPLRSSKVSRTQTKVILYSVSLALKYASIAITLNVVGANPWQTHCLVRKGFFPKGRSRFFLFVFLCWQPAPVSPGPPSNLIPEHCQVEYVLQGQASPGEGILLPVLLTSATQIVKLCPGFV